jgi:hypothetical protein
MEDLIVLVLQAFFEFVVGVLAYLPIDLIPYSWRREPDPDALAGYCLGWFIGGAVLAWLSLIVFHHTFIHQPSLRIANLALAPLASAFLAEALAKRRERSNPFVVPRNHFWQAFWFTLGLVAVRFAFAART